MNKNHDYHESDDDLNIDNRENANSNIKLDTEPFEDMFFSEGVKSGKSRLDFLKINSEKYSKPLISNFVEVRFKGNHRLIYENPKKVPLMLNELVVVESDGGIDIGIVENLDELMDYKCKNCNIGYNSDYVSHNILQKPDANQLEAYYKKIEDEVEVVQVTKDLVIKYNLDMKVTEAQWQFDRQRLTIYFTAPQRVDFRELVKELAKTFRSRIELRQISSREEAKRLGDFVGPCGRELCCTCFLKNFEHVTLEHARKQHLSNNVAKLSGNCGRLKCCIRYEYDTYAEAFAKYPPIHSIIETPEGNLKIVKVDIFREIFTLYNEANSNFIQMNIGQIESYMKDGKIKFAERHDPDHDNLEDCLGLE